MDAKVKKIAILGSTGSIGQQTLEVISTFPDIFKVVALAAWKNTNLLTKQIKQFQPQMVYSSLGPGSLGKVKFVSMEEIACHPDIDLVVVATSGKSGLLPTIKALNAGKRVALANKEVLVMAGQIVIQAMQYEKQILPIDSEHSAIWQCLEGEKSQAKRLFLTASGGPFYNYSSDQLSQVSVEETLRHPVWKMGKKVTIDSATLMNKGLEVIEAHWLFSISLDLIRILIHPQSIIHSMVEFKDNTLKAQLSFPDMRLPIQYALSYPERLLNPNLPEFDLCQVHSLTFLPVDYAKFPCLRLARDVGKKAGSYPAVLCAADEVAVELFINRKIKFTQIPEIIERTLEIHHGIDQPSLEEIMEADTWARQTALEITYKNS